MSLLPVAWAETAPVADVYERAVITILAHRAKIDGTGAYPSVTTIARFAVCDEQVIRKRLGALLERGVIAYGDQSLAARIPQRYRPKVYDLMIPHEWYSATQIEEVDRQRAQDGLGPYPVAERPLIQKPERSRKRRSDAGCPKPPSVSVGQRRGSPEEQDHLVDGSPSGVSSRSTTPSGSSQGYLVDDGRGIYEIPNTVHKENLSETSLKPGSHASRSTSARPPSEDLFSSSETEDQGHEIDSSSRAQDQGRHGGDQHLATVKESPDPVITAQDVTAKWVDTYREAFGEQPTKPRIGQVGREAKQLLDAGRDPRKVLYAAKTAAASGYPTIVREYDRLVLAHQGRSQGVDPRPSTTDQRVAQALALAAKYEVLDAAEDELPHREAMYVPSTRI